MSDLSIGLDRIELPDSIEFGDDGRASVVVTNTDDNPLNGPVDINLYISTDDDIDLEVNSETGQRFPNDALLRTLTADVDLAPGESQTFSLDYENNTSVIAPGAYNLIAEVSAFGSSDNTGTTDSRLVSAPGTNVIVDWNATMLNAIQAQGEAGQPVSPPVGNRMMAIVSAAVYDAVNAFDRAYTPYAIDVDAPQNASMEAAVVGASYQALIQLLPEQREAMEAQRTRSLEEIEASDSAISAGFDFGASIANQMVALRANDGMDNNAPFVSPEGDYVWRPEPGTTALGPNFGEVTPFAVPDVEQFAPPGGLEGKPDTNPNLYARELEEVRRLGARFPTEATPDLIRTPEQTEIGYFWAYDRPDTFRPYGQLPQILQEIVTREGTSLVDTARLFVQLNTAMVDALISSFYDKYNDAGDALQPRPSQIIAEGYAANDGIEATVADPDWTPLIPNPPFPDYSSGHAAIGGAFAGVLSEYFGDDYQFTAVSQEIPGVVRSYNNFEEAASENSLSRLYAGVHYREAADDGLILGLNTGEYVANNIAQPVSEMA